MKKKTILIIGLLLVASIGTVAFATDGYMNPSEIFSGLAGITVDEAHELRMDGQTYGELAEEQGFLEVFEELNLENRIALINLRVEEGTITQEKADEIIAILENHDCDELGETRMGITYGIRFGSGLGEGEGLGEGKGLGQGQGQGQGMFGNGRR